MHASALYPPVVESIEILGYIEEENGLGYSRDIGNSSILGGCHYYIFGDTFCPDKTGKHTGVQSNTAALIKDPRSPLVSAYLSIQENGIVDALLQLSEEELRLQKDNNVRVVLWAFASVVEHRPGEGLLWYEKGELWPGESFPQHCGVGVAKITVGGNGQLISERNNKLVFGPYEPRIGGFSAAIDAGKIYLYGHHKGNVILAQANQEQVQERHAYTFWNGQEYVADYHEAVPVLEGIQQGSVLKSTFFGAERPWIFIGNTKYLDDQVMVGASVSPAGPWELHSVCQAKGIDFPKGGMYCVFPHLWPFEQGNGEIMVTWSEHWPGGVVAAKLKFEQEQKIQI